MTELYDVGFWVLGSILAAMFFLTCTFRPAPSPWPMMAFLWVALSAFMFRRGAVGPGENWVALVSMGVVVVALFLVGVEMARSIARRERNRRILIRQAAIERIRAEAIADRARDKMEPRT